jgi:hypothetical protein
MDMCVWNLGINFASSKIFRLDLGTVPTVVFYVFHIKVQMCTLDLVSVSH